MHVYSTSCCNIHGQHKRCRRVRCSAACQSMQDVKQLSISCAQGRHPKLPEKCVLQLKLGSMAVTSSNRLDTVPLIPLAMTALFNAQRS